MQMDVKFDRLSEGWRAVLVELDMGCLVGEVSLPDSSFRGCKVLRRVVWPAGLVSVGESCFESCGLTAVDLRTTRACSLWRRAFFDCGTLSVVRLSRELGIIGSDRFTGPVYPRRRGCPLKAVDLTESSVREIGDRAVEGCEVLDDVRFPTSLMDLGSFAFSKCCELRSVDMSTTQLTRLGTRVFSACTALREVKLPSTLMELGEYSLAECGVMELDLGGTKCCSFSTGALFLCGRLRRLWLPVTMRLLGDQCLRGAGLEVLDLSETKIEAIGERAFCDCEGLRELLLPRALKSMGGKCLGGTGVQVLDLSMTHMRIFDWYALYGAGELYAVMLPRQLEGLAVRYFDICLWALDLHVDHLKGGGDAMGRVRVTNRVSLCGAAWWSKCGFHTVRFLFSGCVGAVGGRATRALMPAT
jgi:hypothetical protein